MLLDAGANAECQPEWLVQFAQMGAVYARERFGIDRAPGGAAVDRRGATKGNPLVKETHELLAERRLDRRHRCRFIGNVEGRDLMTDAADVVVTDGFTGNVVLKTLEGGIEALVGGVAGRVRRRRRHPARPPTCCCRPWRPLYAELDPENVGGRHAARRRRRVHHQPRLVVGHAPWSTPSGWPRDWSAADVVEHLRAAIAVA